MCGIIGYKGFQDSNKVVLEGLQQLEYRGYDSWGIAVPDENKIFVAKNVGKISEVKSFELPLKMSNVSIGHTRWATNGVVSVSNAHPHTSVDGNIAVVHNGIIENHQVLREELEQKGYIFVSDTDTEVIPHMIHSFMKNGASFKDALYKTFLKLDGRFAAVVLNQKTQEIGFGKQGSPLVVGIKKNEFFIASDVPAFIAHTKQVIYLDDYQFGVIGDTLDIYDLHTQKEIVKKTKYTSMGS